MSAPRILAQVVVLGSQILGKAFVEAWRQAARNAQGTGRAGSSTMNGGGGKGSSAMDGLTRTHRMSLDEATDILNLKRNADLASETELQKMLKNFDHLFKANMPTTAAGKPHSSHYLQSKIVRAKERIEAEIGVKKGGGGGATGTTAQAGAEVQGTPGTAGTPPPS
ncbi:BQ2448_3211 [Microbotryum intermedium]|uniref:Mitochondrial import inner membrane translocase subunit TIM16 n=1 Tax=Microbotryum intermedium TaxID=269621 RepID=A0A238FHZ7_9BASI|nr:BQ2448_3211 [Microbotryum intermedium]